MNHYDRFMIFPIYEHNTTKRSIPRTIYHVNIVYVNSQAKTGKRLFNEETRSLAHVRNNKSFRGALPQIIELPKNGSYREPATSRDHI